MRRALRAVLLVPAFAVLAVLVVALVAWGLLHTRYGQEELRRATVQQLDDALPEAAVDVATASFSLTGEVVLRDVALTVDGARAVSAVEVRVEVDLLALMSRELRLPRIHIVEPVVDARLDLARLAPRLASPEDVGLAVSVDRVAVDGGTLLLPDATLTDVHAEATVDLAGHALRIVGGTARWRDRGLDLALDGWLRERDGVLLVADARARLGSAEAVLELGSYEPKTGAVAAWGQVRAPADALLAIAGDALPAAARRWRGAVDAEVTALRAAGDAAWELSMAGSVGTAEVAARANVDGAQVRGRLRAESVRPAALYEGAPRGAVDAVVVVEPGALSVEARGSLAGVVFERVDARGEGRWLAGTVVAEVVHGGGSAQLELRGQRGDDGGLRVDDARLRGDVGELIAPFARLPMRALAVDLQASGPSTDLLVAGTVEARELRYGTTRAAALRARLRVPHVSLTAPSPRLAGFVDATAYELEAAGRHIGYARAVGRFGDGGRALDVDVVLEQLGIAEQLRAEVVVERGARQTTLVLGDVYAFTGDLVWRGRGGRVAFADSGRLTVDDLDLESPAGSLHLHGVLDAARARHAEGRLLVELRGFDLERGAPAWTRIAGVDRPLAGTVDAELALQRRGAALSVEAVAELRQLVWRPGVAPVDGSIDFAAGNGWLSTVTRVMPHDYPGELRAEVEAAIPFDTLDGSAWRQLDLDAIQRAELAIDGLGSDAIAAIAGRELPVDGVVSGTVALADDAARAFDLELRVDELSAWRVEDLAVRYRGRWDDRQLYGRGALAHAGAPVVDGELAVAWGLSELWRRPLSELAEAELLAHGSAVGLDLRRLRRAGVVDLELAGWLDAELELTGSLSRAKLVVPRARATQLVVAGVDFPRVAISGEWHGDVLRGAVRAQQSGGGSLAVEGELAWRAEPLFKGAVEARSFDLRALRVFAADGEGVLAELEGVFDAELTADGTATRPRLRGTARARRLGMWLEGGTRRVEDGELDVRFASHRAYVERLAANTGRGRVAASGAVNLASRTFELDAKITELPIAVRAYIAAVDAEGHYSGRWYRGGLDSRAELRSATVTLADTGRQLQDLGPLEDVAYVDRLGGPGRSDVAAVVESAIPVRVRLVTLAPVHVKSPEAEAWLNADLSLRYQGILDHLEGEVTVDEGRFRLLDRWYRIATATARLDGPMPIDPELDIELRRTFPYAIVSIFVTDRLADPRIELRSDNPDYSDEQVLAIILGQDPDSTAAARSPGAQAGGVAANIIVGRIARDRMGLPIDIVRAHPDGYEIGKYLFKGSVLVGYRTRTTEVVDKNRNEGTIEWRLRRDVIVEGSYGDANAGAADVLYVIRF